MKPNRAERVIAFLEARYPGWVPAIELEPVGGRQAWRTAVSEARAIVKGHGDDIENRTRHMRRPVPGESWEQTWTLSEYRLVKRGESSRTADAVAGTGAEGKAEPSRKDFLRASAPHASSERQDLRASNETAPRDCHNLNEWGLR